MHPFQQASYIHCLNFEQPKPNDTKEVILSEMIILIIE